MPKRVHHVRLREEERNLLTELINKGNVSAQALKRAHILLAADENAPGGAKSIREIVEAYKVSQKTVQDVRVRFCQKGLEATLVRKRREIPPCERKITDAVEAQIIAIGGSEPPDGHSRWTLKQIAHYVVLSGVVDSLSHTSVATVLKKHR